MIDHLPVLVIAVPLLTALFIPLAERVRRGCAWPLVMAALLFSTFGAVYLLVQVASGPIEGKIRYAMGDWSAPVGIEYVVDRLNGIVLTMVAVAGLLSALWMRSSLPREVAGRARSSYYTVFLLCCTGYMGISITGDIFNLYVFLEIASITTYVLIAMGRRRQALYAGYSYLIIGSIGATFILLGIGHIYMRTGMLSMADILALFRAHPELFQMNDVHVGFAFLTVGLAVKMALFPLHGWQPSAYAEAPAAASLFIAATSTKVAAYVLYRVSVSVYGAELLTQALTDIRHRVRA